MNGSGNGRKGDDMWLLWSGLIGVVWASVLEDFHGDLWPSWVLLLVTDGHTPLCRGEVGGM